MPKKRFVKAIVLTLIICFALGIGAFLLIRSGAIIPNASAAGTYPVQGVDVSSYQGKIDWAVLADQNLQFAFIKATEGSSAVDPCFRTNYQAAKDTDLRIGAYHFFSYDSAGKTQAENFISVVPADDTLLPPVVDVEFYGNYAWYPPERETVRRELDVLLALLEAHYGKQPILYATEHAYRLFLSEGYSDYDIWIRDVFSSRRFRTEGIGPSGNIPTVQCWTAMQEMSALLTGTCFMAVRKSLIAMRGPKSKLFLQLRYPEKRAQGIGL